MGAEVSKKKSVKLLPAIRPTKKPCLCCGSLDQHLPMDAVIAVGFGSAFCSMDGKVVIEERRGDEYYTVQHAEELALANPNHDWQIHLHGPLRGRVFQRHEPGKWVLVEEDDGFA